MRYQGKQGFRHDDQPRLGVIVANLGTPDAPDTPSLRRYLAQFLGDPRVIELPRILWRAILHGIVLRTRPSKSAASYREVWTDDGSPLYVTGTAQTEGIKARLDQRLDGPVEVALAMRYGSPSIPESLQKLRDAGAERIVMLPLFPQYSGTTTASAFDALADEFKQWRWIPEFRFIGQYHDDARFIRCLAQSIRDHWANHGQGEKLIFSFHGTPKRYLLNGDPYHCQCQKTARLVAEELQLSDDEWLVAFQSRFGNEEWLKPYTDETVTELARNGMQTIDVICPGFSADCLETLDEIQNENREYFEEAGGEALRYIPCLNARSDHLDFLTELVMEHVQGWPEAGGPPRALRDPETTRERAYALGSDV
jgi:ferrochelatase